MSIEQPKEQQCQEMQILQINMGFSKVGVKHTCESLSTDVTIPRSRVRYSFLKAFTSSHIFFLSIPLGGLFFALAPLLFFALFVESRERVSSSSVLMSLVRAAWSDVQGHENGQ